MAIFNSYVKLPEDISTKKTRFKFVYVKNHHIYCNVVPFGRLIGKSSKFLWPCSIFTLWLFNIAMENGPFIYGLPIKHGDFM